MKTIVRLTEQYENIDTDQDLYIENDLLWTIDDISYRNDRSKVFIEVIDENTEETFFIEEWVISEILERWI